MQYILPYAQIIPIEKRRVKPNSHSITELAQTVNKEQKHLPRKCFLHTVASVLIFREDLGNTFKRQKLGNKS